MITIKEVYKGKTALLEISGHAEYAEHGKDIVCSSVSTACIISANLMEKLKLKSDIIDLVCEEGYFRFEIKTEDFTSVTIFDNLVEVLRQLQKDYPKYIKYKN